MLSQEGVPFKVIFDRYVFIAILSLVVQFIFPFLLCSFLFLFVFPFVVW